MGDYSVAPISVDTLGANTATSEGTNMSGASGTYVEIVASTTRAYRAVVLVPNVSSNDILNLTVTYTVATGAAGSEADLGSRIFTYNNAEFVVPNTSNDSLIPANIAAGTRLSVKHTIASNPDRYGVTLIGIP
jgi:hypothetical protein